MAFLQIPIIALYSNDRKFFQIYYNRKYPQNIEIRLARMNFETIYGAVPKLFIQT